jgi:uncharacterized protein involved in response to NO
MILQTAKPAFPLTWAELRNEPFRLLFPLGFMLASLGIGVWIPYWIRPEAFPYPGQGHAMLQIQGFLLCFILGFLMTMLPKVMGVPPVGPLQLALFPPAFLALAVCAWIPAPRAQAAAQLLHLFLIGNFLAFILMRWKKRRGTPPAQFVFIPMAMAADLAGTVMRLLVVTHSTDANLHRAAILLQYQAFPLLLVLGIGGFLLPKLFGSATVDPKDLRNQPRNPMGMPLAMGALFLAGFAVEEFAAGLAPGDSGLRLGYALRAGVWAWFILGRLRLPWISRTLPAYLAATRFSLYAMGAGMVLPIFLPRYLIAWEHLIFVSGILWLTLSIASRVMAAHGGRPEMLEGLRKRSIAFGSLIALAALARVTADVWQWGHWLHLACASLLALAALAIWGRIFLPMILRLPGTPAPAR